MRNKILFILAALGVAAAVYSSYIYSRETPALPPRFNPASNPYSDGIYANGIVESFQSHGENINIYPEVSGPITKILVTEGAHVQQGAPLLLIDDAVQRATTEQQKSASEAALASLNELNAQPRPEVLEVARVQVEYAKASLKSAKDQLDKMEQAYAQMPGSVSRDVLDTARNAANIAESNLDVVQKQYVLTRAGAWSYDVEHQQREYEALNKAYQASCALLTEYTIRAPIDGIVLSIQSAPGSYVSSQGAYGTYTQDFQPLIVMGTSQDYLEVRCYIDEILVHRLPDPQHIAAKMYIRGTNASVPLTFERLQPYISPKIELSNQRQERVDVRVLPMIFSFEKPKDMNLYPGQLMDVYIGQSHAATTTTATH
jgi:HlyD family secretion protein